MSRPQNDKGYAFRKVDISKLQGDEVRGLGKSSTFFIVLLHTAKCTAQHELQVMLRILSIAGFKKAYLGEHWELTGQGLTLRRVEQLLRQMIDQLTMLPEPRSEKQEPEDAELGDPADSDGSQVDVPPGFEQQLLIRTLSQPERAQQELDGQAPLPCKACPMLPSHCAPLVCG